MLFDTEEFSERLFFPTPRRSPCPSLATDMRVEVEGAVLHLRRHDILDASVAPTVLLFHGNGETVSDYDGIARSFAACGANLAVVDYRGYGQSTGVPSLRAVIEDAPIVLAAMRTATASPLFVMGRSLGSACAAEIYGNHASGIRGFIWESGLVDLHALARRRGMTLTDGADALAPFEPTSKLKRGTAPLLVLHGREDSIIDPSEAARAFEAAGTAARELVYIDHRGHNDLSLAAPYWEAMKTFIAANL